MAMAVTGSWSSYPRACCALLILLLAMAAVHASMAAEEASSLEKSRFPKDMDLTVCLKGATDDCCKAIKNARVEISCICQKLKSMKKCDVAEKCKSRCPITCRPCNCTRGAEEGYAY